MRVVYETELLRITRRRSNGADEPTKMMIRLNESDQPNIGMRNRELHVSIDELFDLAEALDDVCDEIEDKG